MRSPRFTHYVLLAALVVLAIGLVPLTARGGAPASPHAATAAPSTSAAPATLSPTAAPATPVACSGAIQHPIQVSVRALDPIRRGGAVRLEVRTSGTIELSAAEVRLVSDGGATVLGARRFTLGRLAPQRERRAEFRLQVPAQGHRFLAQFEVRGEGPNGPVSRGATFNLLPDGPAQSGRRVTGSAGETVVEYQARRIER